MKANTRIFGEIDIAEDKIIHFVEGIIGFPDMKEFALIFDEEKEDGGTIIWLQSMQEPEFAMPIMNPHLVKPDYNPVIEDEVLKPLGTLTQENTMCFVTVTIPKEIENLSVNLKAPLVINADQRTAAQIIVDEEFPVKYPIYHLLEKKEAK